MTARTLSAPLALGLIATLATSCSREPEGKPIQWGDSMVALDYQQTRQHRLQCPPNGQPSTVYGHDIYTGDSSICTAAAHVGAITVERGGAFILEVVAPPRFFGASVRHNITTSAYGPYAIAFRIGAESATSGATPAVRVLWNSSGSITSLDDHEPYKIRCPPAGKAGTIYGHDAYTADSSICTAAVHAGVITLEGGGDVTAFSAPGRRVCGASVRNGVTSDSYGQYHASFTIGSNAPVSQEAFPLRWESSGGGLPADNAVRVQCPSTGRPGSVWGTDVYTSDSSVCTAAAHAGVITLNGGGLIRVVPRGAQEAFAGSERHGVSSSSYGAYRASFSVEAAADQATP